MDKVWKQFDAMELSHSGVHHLMAVHELHKENGYARGIDIARYLNITRGSVSVTLSKLKTKGYLTEDNNKFYRLTAKGVNAVNSVLNRRRIIERFFREVLQVPGESATEDACKVEHLLSLDTADRLHGFMEFLLSSDAKADAFLQACIQQLRPDIDAEELPADKASELASS